MEQQKLESRFLGVQVMISNQLGREIFRTIGLLKIKFTTIMTMWQPTTMPILLFNCCRSPVCLHDPWQDGLHDGWYCDQHGSWRDVWQDSWLGGWHCCLSLCLPAWWLTSLQGADSLSCHTYLWQWIVSFLYCVSKKNFLFFSLMRSSTSKKLPCPRQGMGLYMWRQIVIFEPYSGSPG